MDKLNDSKENCPACKTNLQGQPIPANQQEAFGATHFSRKIGLEFDRDRVEQWKCPDCGYQWRV